METSTTFELNNAQLFWDAQDPNNEGWLLRYRDENGTENSVEIGEDKDASTETLAHQVADCTPDGATGEIQVYRGDQKRGVIEITGGTITNWRAL